MKKALFFALSAKLMFILLATSTLSQAKEKEPYLNGGHFSALNEEWKQEGNTAQTVASMSPADIAASNCDALAKDALAKDALAKKKPCPAENSRE